MLARDGGGVFFGGARNLLRFQGGKGAFVRKQGGHDEEMDVVGVGDRGFGRRGGDGVGFSGGEG